MKKIVLCFFLLLAQVTTTFAEQPLTPELLAKKFNLRTIYSSYGQGLKTFCESYPVDFFPVDSIKYKGNMVIFETKSRYLVLDITGDDEIEVSDQILSPGNYYSNIKYKVFFDKENCDIRAAQTFIPVPNPCVPYAKRRKAEE